MLVQIWIYCYSYSHKSLMWLKSCEHLIYELKDAVDEILKNLNAIGDDNDEDDML